MGFIDLIIAMPAAAMLFATYLVMKDPPRQMESQAAVSLQRSHAYDSSIIVRSYRCTSPTSRTLLFYVAGAEGGERLPGDHHGLTLKTLAEIIPWIPGGSSVFLVSEEGFSQALVERLERFNTTREISS